MREDDVFWDNFWLFKKKEEEKRIKAENADSDEESEAHKPSIKIGEVMKNPHILLKIMLQKRFRKLRRNFLFYNSIGGVTLMAILFIVQLKYSRRFRNYSKVLIHFILFLVTISGLGGSLFLFYLGIKAKKRQQLENKSDEYDIKNEELPDLKSEVEFRRKID